MQDGDAIAPDIGRDRIGLALLSPEFEVLYLNTQMSTWFPGIDLNNKHLCFHVFQNPPVQGACPDCPVDLALKDGQTHAAITTNTTPGGLRHYHVVASPVTNEQGRISAVFEIVEELPPEKAEGSTGPSGAGVLQQAAVPAEMVDLQATNRALLQELQERKRVETETRNAERHYRLLAENATDVIWTMDLSLRSTYISPSVTRLLGYSVDEAMQLLLTDFLTPPDYQHAIAEFKRVINGYREDAAAWLDATLRMEFDLVHKDGSRVPVETVFSFMLDAGGYACGILSHVRGIADRRQADRALRTSEESIRALLNAIQESAVLLDLNGRVIAANQTIANRLGAGVNELTGSNIYDYLDPHVAAYRRQKMLQAVQQRMPVRFEDERAGRIMENSLYPIFDENGQVTRLAVLGFDITDYRQAMERLRLSEQRYRMLTDNVTDVIWTMDMQLRFTTLNPSITRLLGYSVEEGMQLNLGDILSQESMALALQTFVQETTPEAVQKWSSNPGSSLTLELEHVHKDGHTLWVEVKMSLLTDGNGAPSGILGISRDVDDRRHAAEKLQYLATHDALTGLPTRQLLMDRLEHAIERAVRSDRSGAVMLLDMDNFKDINDTRGHAIGDRVLQIAAQRMGECLRKIDTVARSGGDEFTFVLENVENVEFCRSVAERLLESLAAPMDLDGTPASLTASIGICLFPAQGDRADDLLHKADIAMYLAKRQRNACRVYSG